MRETDIMEVNLPYVSLRREYITDANSVPGLGTALNSNISFFQPSTLNIPVSDWGTIKSSNLASGQVIQELRPLSSTKLFIREKPYNWTDWKEVTLK